MDDSVSGRCGLSIVRDKQHGTARRCELAKVLQNFGGVLRIEVSGRLISEQNFRLVQQCTSESRSLTFSAAEFAGSVCQAMA